MNSCTFRLCSLRGAEKMLSKRFYSDALTHYTEYKTGSVHSYNCLSGDTETQQDKLRHNESETHRDTARHTETVRHTKTH